MPDALGLDQYMQEAYKVLVRERQCTTEQVAAHLGVACPDAEKTLDRLTTAGLATKDSSHSTGPPRVVPLDPQQTVAVKLARKQAELKAEQQELSRARESVAALVAAFAGDQERTDPRNLSRGTDAVRARVADLLGRARTDVVGIIDDNARSVAFELGNDVVQAALNRGVSFRILHPRSTMADPQYVSRARWLNDSGGQARTSASLPPPMLVVDGTTALLPADGTNATALVVHNRPLSRALSMLFEQLWNEADTSTQRATTSPKVDTSPQPETPDGTRPPTQSEVELLHLLGNGMTDASAARQLGVSLRTVRRMMADLMARLGARSRFEAGLRAAERGWLRQGRTVTGNVPRAQNRAEHASVGVRS